MKFGICTSIENARMMSGWDYVEPSVQDLLAADVSDEQWLVDSYHLWAEDEPLENVERAMKHIRHVHVADRAGRVAPGVSGVAAENDYCDLFRLLKSGGYDQTISVEALGFKDIAGAGPQ